MANENRFDRGGLKATSHLRMRGADEHGLALQLDLVIK
jgi:hypothetical protein